MRKPIRTYTDAKKAFVQFEAAVLAGTYFRGPSRESYTFSDLIDDYLRDYFLPKGRNNSNEQYKFAALRKKFGGVRPEDLGTIDVARWVNTLRSGGRGPATIHRYVARLKAILNWGYNHELFPTLKVRWGALDLETEGSGRARRLDEGEEDRLKAAASPWLRQLIEAALDTGLRAGALLGLTFSMVRDGGLVVPRRLLKNKKATHDLTIPLTARLRAIIAFRQCGPHGQQLGGEKFIFGSTWGLKRKSFRRDWEGTREGAGLTRGPDGKFDLHWHDLRGEFATRLHEAGVPIETISHLLDHSTLEMTMRYIKQRTRSSKPAEAIAALEQFQAAFNKNEQDEKVNETIQ